MANELTKTKRQKRHQPSVPINPSIFADPARPLTDKQQEFVIAFVSNGGKQMDAALAAGYSPDNASQSGSQLVRNPLIQQEITKETLKHIGMQAAHALQTVSDLSTSAKSEYVRLQAAQDLLDRAGFKPPDRVDHRIDSSLTVHLNLGQTLGQKTI